MIMTKGIGTMSKARPPSNEQPPCRVNFMNIWVEKSGKALIQQIRDLRLILEREIEQRERGKGAVEKGRVRKGERKSDF